MLFFKKIFSYSLTFLLGTILSFLLFNGNLFMDKKEIHVLEKPILVNSLSEESGQGGYYVLPKGTVLYNDSDSLNTRVLVYFNVVGDLGLDFKEQNPEISKQPSEVEVIDSMMLPEILKKINLNKDDIKSIIDEDKNVPANVKNILYKKYNIVE